VLCIIQEDQEEECEEDEIENPWDEGAEHSTMWLCKIMRGRLDSRWGGVIDVLLEALPSVL
jgi:hypothetical protein